MKLHLLTKLLLSVLAPALIGLCAVAGFGWRTAENTLTAQRVEEITLVLERQQSELKNITGLLSNLLQYAGRSEEISMLLAPGSNESRQLAAVQAQAVLKRMVHDFPLLTDLGVLDAHGKVAAHTNPKMLGADLSDRNYFNTALQGKPGIENVQSRGTRHLTTIIAHPVPSPGGISGVVYGTIDIATLSAATTDTIAVGRSGICYVYEKTGKMLMHPNKKYVGDEDGNNGWTRRILEQKNGRVDYVWNGAHKIAFFRAIPAMDWIVVLAVEQEDLLAPVTAMLRHTALIVIAGTLTVGLIIFFVARNLAAALRDCAGFAEHVAGGNLSITPVQKKMLQQIGSRGDELGILARSIRDMVENIIRLFDAGNKKTEEARQATEEACLAMNEAEKARHAAEVARREGMLDAAGQLEHVAQVVSLASNRLTSRIAQSERGAEEQATRASETATAIEEMNAAVLEVARSAGQTSEMSAVTRRKAKEGATIVKKAVESIRRVQQASLTLKDDMTALDEHAKAITRIMGVISDVADQTNLLALNAAIEAARTGEAGRGFAVVADEVRKLAEKTMASTSDVDNAIKAIQESADKNVAQVEYAVKIIDEAANLAHDSGQALEEIVSMTDATADQIQAIAAASKQQSAAGEEINRSATQVNAIAAETAEAMREAADAVTELAAQTQNLSALIEKMRKA